MRNLVTAGAALILLSACGDSSSSNQDSGDRPTAEVKQTYPDIMDQINEMDLPEEQADFEKGVFVIYFKAKSDYDAAPNDAIKSNIQQKWGKEFCKWVNDHKTFTGWKGKLVELSQPNVTVIYRIDLGLGLQLQNDPQGDLDTTSPADKALLALHVPSDITVSGKFADALMGDCNVPYNLLSKDLFEKSRFEIDATSINGALAKGTGGAGGASS
jgi:hypothetical protein